jgi:hypothetical protein
VVRHLEDVDAVAEALQHGRLGALLGVSEQEDAQARPLDEQDHARIVGRQAPRTGGRP